jgi:8-oxo-dGTP diphosphatase
MIINSKIHHNDKVFNITYKDADDFTDLTSKKVTQVSGVCFFENRLVLVLNGKRKTWGLPGGTVEAGETLSNCLEREIKEETNMEVLDYRPIGYQKIDEDHETIYQVRYACKVKPIGNFESDPDHTITEIKLIDPNTYKEYFDWQDIGERLIKRGLELKNKNGW